MAIINGTPASETLFGTPGNDTITGAGGNDVVRMRGGDDVYVWNSGDGDDKVEGQDGFDTLLVNGSSTGLESLLIGINGTRAGVLRFFEGIVADVSSVERIWVRALGDSDGITVDDLTGTNVQQVVVDLAGTVGGTDGDGMIDGVFRNGTFGSDTINLTSVNGRVFVSGLSAQLIISHADANDELEIDSLAGNDIINASTLAAGIMQLTIDGGNGNDVLTGSKGNDELFGDDGNDIVVGDDGDDVADLGAGNDVFAWAMGDGKDTIQGGDDTDTLLITASAGSSFSIIHDNGGLLRAATYINGLINGEIIADDVERIRFRALTGSDIITVGDLVGLNVSAVYIDLAATRSGTLPDADFDSVSIQGTKLDDVMEVTWTSNKIVTSGLPAGVSIANAGVKDELVIFGGFGNDLVDASALPAGKILLEIKGSVGNDIIFGSAGNDTVDGGEDNDVVYLGAGNDVLEGSLGNDVAFLGAGNDTFLWSFLAGKDIVKGQTGIDTLQVSCSSADEIVGIDTGGIVRVTGGGDTVDLYDVERVRVLARDGKDGINVSDLAGTDVTQVAIDLSGKVADAGDGQQDSVGTNGTSGNDQVTVAMSGSIIFFTGLPAQVTVAHADSIDLLFVDTGQGNDSINAVSLLAGAMQFNAFGGIGHDTITGSAGNDNLSGENGNDLLRGGSGADRLIGGYGNDRLEGGAGDDFIAGGPGNDTITGGTGNDTVFYESVLFGHDVILDFDGNPVSGQDTLDLDFLFDNLGVAAVDRAGRVFISDNGATVDVEIDADGNAGNGFELTVATLHTLDTITVGQDVIVGT